MNNVAKVALIICIIGIIMFVIGSTTGTITGYQGADGQYYSNPGATSGCVCRVSFSPAEADLCIGSAKKRIGYVYPPQHWGGVFYAHSANSKKFDMSRNLRKV